MQNSFLVLTLVGLMIRCSIAVAQSNGVTTKMDTSETPRSSTITTPGTVNTGETANTGLLSADTAVSVFVLQALSASQKEIELGKIAQNKAVNKDVKGFASKMIADHSRTKSELNRLADNKNIPYKPSGYVKDSLMTLEGSEFDKAYMSLMVSDHENSINLFSKAAETAKDTHVKAFVTKTLPMLRKHYEMAKKLSHKLGRVGRESHAQ